MVIQARTLVGAAGVLIVAAVVVLFSTLMSEHKAADMSQRHASVEVSEVKE